jgi:hypothetical protein
MNTLKHLKIWIARIPGDTLKATVFLGEQEHTLQNAGTLYLRVDEWQVLSTALAKGAAETNGQLVFTVEGDAPRIAKADFPGYDELLAACRLGIHAIELTIEAGETKPSESWAGILQTMRAAIAKVKP